MDRQPTAAVVVSTYNGEHFLSAQLDSILAQTGVSVQIYVRDDGSTDGTKEILHRYEASDHRVHVEEGENVGVGASFMRGLYAVPKDYDYYAFSDQDDIWMPEKLLRAVHVLQKTGKGLYTSNQMVTDSEGREVGLRFQELPDLRKYSILQQNRVSGCTIVMTDAFCRMLTEEKRRPQESLFQSRIHDVWVIMAGAVTKQLVYDRRAFIYYRQHEHNVIGAKETTNADRIRTSISRRHNPQRGGGRSKLAKEICACYGDYLGSDPLMRACANPHTFRNKRMILKNYRYFHTKNRLLFVSFVLLDQF